MAVIYTIGHSTRSFDELVQALQAHGIRVLADIRSYPSSRRLPHFNREHLEQELPKHGLEYVWMKDLGGRRKKLRPDSPNIALRNESFRNYADHMLTPEFHAAAADLVRRAEQQPLAYMCAERMWFQCHRMLLSDYLVANGHQVLHIEGTGPVREHRLMSAARPVEGNVIYDAGALF